MSALTDLFSAMANKIRSKTGTATTYTPAEMVSNGIDDVYAAGYDAGGGGSSGIPITPSDLNPPSLSNGLTYEAQGNGYAIYNYHDMSPSDSYPPDTLYENYFYRIQDNDGHLIKTIGGQIEPSNTNPPALTSGPPYYQIVSSNGYAIESYTDITPSTSGTAFSSGFNKMSGSGYAYSQRPSLVPTTLWTNSSPSSNFTSTSITTESMLGYDYIGVKYRTTTSSSDYVTQMMSLTDFQKTSSSPGARFDLGYFAGSGNGQWARTMAYSSATQLSLGSCQRIASNNTNNAYCIPVNVYGYKLTQ